jgi:hypothetical protein
MFRTDRENAMTMTATHDDRAKKKGTSTEVSSRKQRNGDARPGLVTAGALAVHLSCVRSYVAKLVDQGVLERRADGRFDQDACRAKYISHLKEERKRSPRSEADTAFQQAKTELIRLRILEKQRVLIEADEALAMIDRMCGLFISGLSSFAARIGGRDIATRIAVDRAVRELRLEISNAASEIADQRGEPPLDDAA